MEVCYGLGLRLFRHRRRRLIRKGIAPIDSGGCLARSQEMTAESQPRDELHDLAHQEILVLTQLLGRCTIRLRSRWAGVRKRTFTSDGAST